MLTKRTAVVALALTAIFAVSVTSAYSQPNLIHSYAAQSNGQILGCQPLLLTHSTVNANTSLSTNDFGANAGSQVCLAYTFKNTSDRPVQFDDALFMIKNTKGVTVFMDTQPILGNSLLPTHLAIHGTAMWDTPTIPGTYQLTVSVSYDKQTINSTSTITLQ